MFATQGQLQFIRKYAHKSLHPSAASEVFKAQLEQIEGLAVVAIECYGLPEDKGCFSFVSFACTKEAFEVMVLMLGNCIKENGPSYIPDMITNGLSAIWVEDIPVFSLYLPKWNGASLDAVECLMNQIKHRHTLSNEGRYQLDLYAHTGEPSVIAQALQRYSTLSGARAMHRMQTTDAKELPWVEETLISVFCNMQGLSDASLLAYNVREEVSAVNQGFGISVIPNPECMRATIRIVLPQGSEMTQQDVDNIVVKVIEHLNP